MLCVVSDRANVVVAHWKIDAAISIRVSHRTARSQIVPDGVRIMAPVWVVVIEVSCPIDDRRTFPHGCLLHGHGADRPGMLALDCQGPIRLQASIRARMEAMRLGTQHLGISRPDLSPPKRAQHGGFAALSATSRLLLSLAHAPCGSVLSPTAKFCPKRPPNRPRTGSDGRQQFAAGGLHSEASGRQ